MKVISWNVNGLRACVGKGFSDFLYAEDPDIICVQETKMEREQADFEFPGYYEYWNSATSRKGYSGTAVFSKIRPLEVSYGLGLEEADCEGRLIRADYGDFYLVTVYSPNSQRDLKRLDFRMRFEDRLRDFLKELNKTKPVILCGDMNVAHRPIDIKNSRANIGNSGYTYEERGKFAELLASGFLDVFRHYHPDSKDAYTWWSYRGNARENNTGWRIDYFLADGRIIDRISSVKILPEVLGSDHCPVEIEIEDLQS